MSEQLANRRILVTGASSGIGTAAARQCAAAGAHVALLGRRRDRVAQLAKEIGERAVAVPADVRNPQLVGRAVETAAREMGGIDGLVNAAGLNRAAELDEADVEHWRQMLETNLLGVFIVTQAVLSHLLRAETADVLNVSSMSGRRPLRSDSAVYAATKSALNAWSEALSWDLGPRGVRVTVLSPGLVATEFGMHTVNPDRRREMEDRLERVGLAPEVVADQVVYMLSQPAHVRLREVAVMPARQAR